MIALQRKIDGQSLANMDDVPWYGVGPSEPTPIPILGPDIIDPRQMDTIRRQAELAAQGKAYGVRELPSITLGQEALATTSSTATKTEEKAVVEEKPGPTVSLLLVGADEAEAERKRRREAAIARKQKRS
jgi:hypothetical protein